MADVAELGRRFRTAANDHRARAPFHARLCDIAADEPAVAELLATAPEEQQLPVLLLAAVHEQVLADPGCPLAAWYPSVAPEPRSDDVRAAFVEHCRQHADALRTTIRSRTTQTNEVGRCGLLLPAFGMLADEVGPLAWADVGASAGLNLHLDRFRYRYRPGGAIDGTSEVRIDVATRGHVPVPRAMPDIVRRIGLDRDPVSPDDAAAARWLRACVWPDQLDRLRRLDAALDLARSEPIDVRRGDVVDDLPAIVDELRRAAHPVLSTSWVLNYLSDTHRAEFVRLLDRLGEHLDLSWVFAEAPRQAPGLPFDPAVVDLETTVVGLVRWRGGHRRAQHLGTAHPHGFWFHWHG